MKKIKTMERYTDLLFILPSLVGVSIFVLIPFADVIRRSFLNVTGKSFVGIKNYTAVFSNRAFLLAGENTLKFVGICIPLLIILSLLIAVLLNQGILGGHFLKSAFLIPMAIPVATIVLFWRLLFHQQGILNGILQRLSIEGDNWMETDAAFVILVGSYLWKNLGYNIVLWLAGLSGIPDVLYQAAEMDGANRWKRFIYITLPILKPTLYTITTLAFLNSFKVFREAYLVAGAYPHESIYLLQHLFNNWFRDLALDKMSAAAVTMVIIILISILFLQKLWGAEHEN